MAAVRAARPLTGLVGQRRLRRTVVAAGLASYLDAAALVTVAIALPLWRQHHGLAVWQVGLLTSGLSCAVAVGAVVGGRLADRFGKERVFTLDLLLFIAGAALVAAADGPTALLLGVTVLGLAVGADLPTSLAIIAAAGAPTSRGRRVGSTQLFWSAGTTGTFALGFTVSGLGATGARLMVGHLLLVGAFTVALRLTVRAELAAARTGRGAQQTGPTVGRPTLPLLVTGCFFLCWQLAATTIGTYGTYYLVTHTGLTQTQATAAAVFTVPPVLMAIAFTRLADTVWRDRLFVVASGLQIVALATGALTGGDLVLGMVVLLLLWSVSNVFGGEAVYRVWSHLLLPASSRATAFGITYGIARIVSAAFLLGVPFLIERDPAGLLWVLTAFVALSGVAGLVLIHHPRLIPALRNGSRPLE